jgi:probable F420-dependent oxidoreductase
MTERLPELLCGQRADDVRFSVQGYWMPEAWIPLVAQEVERAGFEGFWYGDHIAAPIEYEGNYLYSEDGRPSMRLETPIADVFLALAGAAAVTERIMLGSSVVVLPMRPPLITARAVTTLQNMSGGRFRLGIGVGWQREEFEAIGMPFDQRGKRADEILELLPKLWTGEPVEHDGLTCRFGPLRLSPPVVTKVPLLGSGTTAPALRRSARWTAGAARRAWPCRRRSMFVRRSKRSVRLSVAPTSTLRCGSTPKGVHQTRSTRSGKPASTASCFCRATADRRRRSTIA